VKLRVRSSKLGKVRFTSHRDAARIWERALRIAQLPIAATEGFTPRPKISFGLALPTGAESIAEYVDIELRSDAAEVDLTTIPAQISAALPNGFDALVADVREPGTPSLQEAVTSTTWELWSPLLSAEHHLEARRLLDADELIIERERKGKRSADDVRPMILDVDPTPAGDRLVVRLATVGRALRPAEFAQLAYPHLDPLDVRALRTHQWIDDAAGRSELLPLPAGVDAFAPEVFA
jgi:radical SAM-linked protein